MFNPEEDGVYFINVYSKGKTELGRLLSNFARTPFEHPIHGRFASVEALWYCLQCDPQDWYALRGKHGWEAKKLGRKLRTGEPVTEDIEFKRDIARGIKAKLEQNPRILELMRETELPFVHFYVFDGYVKVPSGQEWIMETLEYYRRKLLP